MELTQILLFSVVTILTLLLVVVGVQVFLILWRAKKTLDRLNKILDDAHILTNSVIRPITGMMSFVEGLKSLKSLVSFISDKTGIHSLESVLESNPDIVRKVVEEKEEAPPHIHIQALQERGRRFFHKGGKPLSS